MFAFISSACAVIASISLMKEISNTFLACISIFSPRRAAPRRATRNDAAKREGTKFGSPCHCGGRNSGRNSGRCLVAENLAESPYILNRNVLSIAVKLLV